MSKAESSARNLLATTVTGSIIAAFGAIAFGLNRVQLAALVFLCLALVGSVAAGLFYRRYSALRAQRWQEELRGSECELGRIFEQENASDLPPTGPNHP